MTAFDLLCTFMRALEITCCSWRLVYFDFMLVLACIIQVERDGQPYVSLYIVIQLCLLIQVEVVQREKECSAFLCVF